MDAAVPPFQVCVAAPPSRAVQPEDIRQQPWQQLQRQHQEDAEPASPRRLWGSSSSSSLGSRAGSCHEVCGAHGTLAGAGFVAAAECAAAAGLSAAAGGGGDVAWSCSDAPPVLEASASSAGSPAAGRSRCHCCVIAVTLWSVILIC